MSNNCLKIVCKYGPWLTDRHTDRQFLTSYATNSASWAKRPTSLYHSATVTWSIVSPNIAVPSVSKLLWLAKYHINTVSVFKIWNRSFSNTHLLGLSHYTVLQHNKTVSCWIIPQMNWSMSMSVTPRPCSDDGWAQCKLAMSTTSTTVVRNHVDNHDRWQSHSRLDVFRCL